MKITVTKIKRELIKNHSWNEAALESNANKMLVDFLIKDTLTIVDKILKSKKNISIK